MTSEKSKYSQVVTIQCLECGKEFEGNMLQLMGVKIGEGKGYCPECRGKIRAEEEKQERIKRQFEIAGKRRILRSKSGIPHKFIDQGFDTFDKTNHTDVFKLCVNYAENFPFDNFRRYPWLIMLNKDGKRNRGVGKTHLVCSIAHRIIDRWNGEIGLPVYFTTETELLDRIQATYNVPLEERYFHETKEKIFDFICKIPLLILDDVGQNITRDQKFTQRTLYTIINRRYNADLPVIITTNLTPEKLSFYLGEAQDNDSTYDRIVEMTEGNFITMTGDSYRRSKDNAQSKKGELNG